MPKISILMSVYNKGEFLAEAIHSILDQSYTDFEFIIRDNQSTDNSIDVINSFTDDRIIFNKNSRNLGPVGSLNNCIAAAKGDYITFAHGDDIWEKDFLAINIEHLEKHSSINFCHSLMHLINEHNIISHAQPDNKIGDYKIELYKEAVKKLAKGCYIRTPTAFFRKKAVRFYDYRYVYTCDWDMYLHLAANRNDFMFINRPLIYYRVSSNSETSVGIKSGDIFLESCMTLRNFFNKYQEYSCYRRKAFNKLSSSILRRTGEASSRDTLYFSLGCAILCYPLKVLSPAFHLYLFLGLLFGPRGVRLLKSPSRFIKLLRRPNARNKL